MEVKKPPRHRRQAHITLGLKDALEFEAFG